MEKGVKALFVFLTVFGQLLFAQTVTKPVLINGSGSGYEPKVLGELPSLLKDFRDIYTPEVRSSNKVFEFVYQKFLEFEAGLPEYRKTMVQAFSDTKGLTIDFVLDLHYLQDQSEEDGKKVSVSQAAAMKVLQQSKPEVIGYEGSYLDPVTIKGLNAAERQYSRDSGNEVTESKAGEWLKERTKFDVTLQYLELYPERLCSARKTT